AAAARPAPSTPSSPSVPALASSRTWNSASSWAGPSTAASRGGARTGSTTDAEGAPRIPDHGPDRGLGRGRRREHGHAGGGDVLPPDADRCSGDRDRYGH